jgi:hypothetical protein
MTESDDRQRQLAKLCFVGNGAWLSHDFSGGVCKRCGAPMPALEKPEQKKP